MSVSEERVDRGRCTSCGHGDKRPAVCELINHLGRLLTDVTVVVKQSAVEVADI